MTLTADTTVVRQCDLTQTDFDEEAVVLSPQAGAFFTFNGVGAEIWSLLAEPVQIGRICAVLAQRYDVDADTLDLDVTQYIDILIANQLAHVMTHGTRDEGED